MTPHYSYTGSILRVDLTGQQITKELVSEEVMKRYVGGTGLGAKYLYENVPPGIEWNDPGNMVFFGSGPLGGTTMIGCGGFSVVTKGATTNGATSSQANGFFGTFLRQSGFHGVAVQGSADDWVYLYIHDGIGELRNARHLIGKDTWETGEAIAKELGLNERQVSVFSIGPAGENLVKFACIVGDRGHVVAHGGIGSVMGAKKLKAIAAKHSKEPVTVKDKQALSSIRKAILEVTQKQPAYEWGTSMLFPAYPYLGLLPVKNLTTNIFADADKFGGHYYRPRWELKPSPCWSCARKHCHIVTVTEGPYAGYIGEEPDYEDMAAWGSLIDQHDPGAAVMLTDTADRLGMDSNEGGWLLAMTIECYEKGLISKRDTDGIEMTWGNVEAVRAMLHKIANREGFGDILAEGTMRAAKSIGAEDIGVYLKTGAAPRGHDHRARWIEMFDVATGNTSTLDSCSAPFVTPKSASLPPMDPFSPDQIALTVAGTKGKRTLEDSLVVCATAVLECDLKLLTDALNSVTGWDWQPEHVWQFGQHIANLLRVFDIRHGHTIEEEYPSSRYSSAPVDGPMKGKSIAPYWEQMLSKYYDHMGWDRKTGKPLPETLKKVGLDWAIKDIWPRAIQRQGKGQKKLSNI